MSEKLKNLKKKLTPKYIACGTFICTLGLAIAAASAIPVQGTEVVLPDSNAEIAGVVTERTKYHLTNADITLDNVQQVIKSLDRPAAYTASVINTLFWGQLNQQIQAVQYVRDGICLTEYKDMNGNTDRYEAVSGGQYYAWRRGGTVQRSGASGTVSTDAMSMIPTYETVVQEDPSHIVEAGLLTMMGEPCIYVTVLDETTGYSLKYWVSTISGLLVQAEYTHNGEIARSIVINDIHREKPSASLFLLPDGTSLLPDDAE